MSQEQLLQIIEQSKKRDHEAFKGLVEYYQPYAFSLAFRLICHEEEAKDIVQESFIKVWKHIHKYNENSKFTTWLYKIVYNLSLDKIKSLKRRKWASGDLTNLELLLEIGNGEHPENHYINKDLAEIIKTLAEGLSPKQQAVFILRDLQGVEMDEISDITSMAKGVVKSNLYYARMNIREKLKKIENIKIQQDEMQ